MTLPSTFRWMAGMATADGWRLYPRSGRFCAPLDDGVFARWEWLDDLRDQEPDLTDPGTLGCLLALVREASGDPLITASASVEADYSDGGPEREETVTWGLASPQLMREALRRVEEASEGEALMATLRALEVPHV